MKPKLHWSYEWLKTQYEVKRRLLGDIGNDCGVTAERIRQKAVEFGLKREPLHLTIDRLWLWHQYVEHDRTQESIALELGLSEGTVTRAVKAYNLVHIPLTKEQELQNNRNYQNYRRATDPEYAAMKQANSDNWKRNHPERWKAYHKDYDRRKYQEAHGNSSEYEVEKDSGRWTKLRKVLARWRVELTKPYTS